MDTHPEILFGESYDDICALADLFVMLSNVNSDDNQGPANGNKRKRKSLSNSVASFERADTILGIS